MIGNKENVANFLVRAGFELKGCNQFSHSDYGYLHLYEWTEKELVEKLMTLGKKHQGKAIRDLLFIEDDYVFEATA